MKFGPIKLIVIVLVLIQTKPVYGATIRPGGTDVCRLPDSQRITVPGGCNFNTGDCGWSFPPYLWSRHNETTGMVIFGHTDNDIGLLQTFAVFQSNDPNVNMSTVAAITSPTIGVTGDICFKFWILMPNQNSRLEIYTLTAGNNSQLVYDYKQTLTSQWKKIEIPIYVTSPFKIMFRSEKENNYGYIGIDSVEFYKEKIPTTTTVSTTTETTTTTTTPTTPTSTPTTPTTVTTTTSPTTTTTQKTTTMTTTTTTEPSTITTESTTRKTITSPTPPTTATPTPTPMITKTSRPTTPTTYSTKKSTKSPCKCDCPTYESKCLRTTATPVSPVPRVCAMPETNRRKEPMLSCNFDKDTCQYTIPVYPHLWERTTSRFGNPSIGQIIGDQSVDHNSGYMLFSTYNNHVQRNQTHFIQTPKLSALTTYCLSFYYIMPTNHSNLYVVVKFTDGSPSKLVWETSSERHLNWTHQYLELYETKPFYVVFKSIKKNVFSFLGLDTVQISADITPSTTRLPIPSVTSHMPSRPGPRCNCNCPVIDCDATTPSPYVIPPCGDLSLATKIVYLSCDFDGRKFCGYNVPAYPHLWELHMFEYGDPARGIIEGDSTNEGDGGYLLFNTDNHHVQPGQTDEVTSLEMFLDQDVCLTFEYNQPTTSSSLQIYQNINGQKTLLWEGGNATTQGWTPANVFIPYNAKPYQIVFSSQKTGLDSYLGIDNIVVYSKLTL